jgi:nucleoside-diphosphate-sugar epimerase
LGGRRLEKANKGSIMRVFVAGATGAIGQPLIAELIRQGHTVTGLTRSESGGRWLKKLGATVALASAFDAAAVADALKRSEAEVVIDQLTSLPKSPADLAAAAPGDRKLRIEGGGNLLRAARACGVRRYIQQASGFFLKSGSGLADESEGMAVDASPGVAASAHTYAELEARLLDAGRQKGSPFDTDSSTARTPGTARTALAPSRCVGRKSRLSDRGKASGPGSISTTLPSRR